MTAARRAPVRQTSVAPSGGYAPPQPESIDEITYRGYRIEPASYGVNTATWSPRVVVSTRTEDSWSRLAPLYATNTARFKSREEADLSALDIAKTWIDRAIERGR